MLKLDFNERCEGTPYWAAEALASLDASALWRYPDRAPLEEKIAALFGVQSVQVLATNGGDEGIDLVLRLARREGRTLVLPLPAFSMYRVTAARNDVRVIEIPGNADLSLDLDAVVEPLQASGRILALTSPNNPTGEVISRERLQLLLMQARAFGNPVLMDEAYAEFLIADGGQSVIDLLRDYDNLIVLRSFSKAYGLAGLRVGCLLAQDKLMSRLRALAAPFNLSTPALRLAQSACTPAAQSEMRQYCRAIVDARDSLRDRLNSWGIRTLASGGNFLLLQLGTARAALVARALQRRGISVRQFTEAELDGCLRVTIPGNSEALERALSEALRPQLLCLDMDGVLIDTRESYDNCVQATVQALSGVRPELDELRALRNSGGFNDDWALSAELLLQRGVVPVMQRVIDTFQNLYLGDAATPGLREKERVYVSDSLRQRLSKLDACIVTGRPRSEAEDGVRLCRLAPRAIISRDDVQAQKPAPEGIRKALNLTAASNAWMIGDSVDDMRAARAADVLAIGVGLGNADALYAAGADLVIADINALEDLL